MNSDNRRVWAVFALINLVLAAVNVADGGSAVPNLCGAALFVALALCGVKF